MKFELPVVQGKIIKRYKRFLADVILDSDFNEYKKGETITAHTANTGSMKTCWEPNWPVVMTFHDNPKRKLKFSLEMTHNGSTWIGINTSLPNKISVDAIKDETIKELQGYENIKPEQKIGKSRIDILLYDGKSVKDATRKCYVEVKNVTMLGENETAIFPDSVSERGQKHLRELTEIVKNGDRASMLYIVQREDVKYFSPAEEIDPEYARLLREAKASGVEVLAYQCSVGPKGVLVEKPIEVRL